MRRCIYLINRIQRGQVARGTPVSRYVPANETKRRASRSPAVKPPQFPEPAGGRPEHAYIMAFHTNCFSLRQISANHGASRQRCDAPRERRRQAGGGRSEGWGEEGSAARSVCGVGASERRGGSDPWRERSKRERQRIDTYIGLYARTHIFLEEIVPG